MNELPCDVEPRDDDPMVALAMNERDAESALWWLTEHGYFQIVERICQEALAALPKGIT